MTTTGRTARHHPAARLLHWTMVVLLGAQFVLGYAMERADDLLEGFVDGWLGGEAQALLPLHAALGVLLLALGVVRAAFRRTVGLPAWAPGLSAFERRLAHRTEQVLYLAMFLIPLTGLALVLVSGEDWDLSRGQWRAPVEWLDDDLLLGAHISTHVVFFAALLVHVGLVLTHTFIHRDRLLRRML